MYWCIVRTVLTGKRCFGRLAILFDVFENTQRQVYGLMHCCTSTREEAACISCQTSAMFGHGSGWLCNVLTKDTWSQSGEAAVQSGNLLLSEECTMSMVCSHNQTAVQSLSIQWHRDVDWITMNITHVISKRHHKDHSE